MQSNKTCKGRGYLLEDSAGLAGCDYLSDLLVVVLLFDILFSLLFHCFLPRTTL